MYVVEGQNITLEWTYDIGGSAFRMVEFRATDLHVLDKVRTNATFIYPDYRGRVTAQINETNAKITFLNVNRTDSKTYRLTVENEALRFAQNLVKITVQCK